MSLRRVLTPLLTVGVMIGAASLAKAQSAFTISSPEFQPGQSLPLSCGFRQANLPPELRVSGTPATTRTLALIVDDPDAPAGLWTHWLIWNLPHDTSSITADKIPPQARQGLNSFGNARYDGPSPPRGTHRYFFHLYALDTLLTVPAGSGRGDLEQAMKDHVIAETEVFGTYSATLTASK